jgi:putative membrane protein
MMGFGFGVMGLGAVLMVLFWVGLIALIVWAATRLFPRQRRDEREVAQETLRRRYAAGEISAAEYEQARRAIG